MIDQKKLLGIVLDQYRLPLDGYHGPVHWARVLMNSRDLFNAWHPIEFKKLGMVPVRVADATVLFALLHDACRHDEYEDAEHGQRGAEFASKLWRDGKLKDSRLSDAEFNLVYEAIYWHTNSNDASSSLVRLLWDSDRLDLDRVGIKPDIRYLGTREQHVIDGCRVRSINNCLPRFVLREWGLKFARE
jgi:uncharacterized protein